MPVGDPLQSKKKVFEVALYSGSDPTPSVSLTNALEIKEATVLNYDQKQMNSQSDVAGRTMVNRSSITGGYGGSINVTGNLHSTDGTTEPAIANSLKLCGMVESASVSTTFSDVTGLSEGDALTGDTSGATGVVGVIDGTTVIIKDVVGTFQVEDVNTGAYTISAISSDNVYTYVPDSDSSQVGSGFLNVDGYREAIRQMVGNFTVSSSSGELPEFTLSFLGDDDDDNTGDAALPDTTYLDNDTMAFICGQVTILPEGGSEVVLRTYSIEYNLGNTPVLLPNASSCTGYDGGYISSRADAGGSMEVRKELSAVFDPKTLNKNNTAIWLSYRFGDGTQGETIYVRQNINIGDFTTGSSDGIETWNITFNAVDNTDNDKDSYLVFA